MALGRAEREYYATSKPVLICNGQGKAREHEAWAGSPCVGHGGGRIIDSSGGHRPYIKQFVNYKSIFNIDHVARAGRVYFDESYLPQRRLEKPYIVVSPHIKANASPNKSWGFERWQRVVDGLDCRVYQLLADPSERVLEGVEAIKTPSFKHAIAIIAGAACVICNEGGSHHMAASYGVPAVVVFGGFTPVSVTGYEFHHNIGTDLGYCGSWKRCDHCQQAMKMITCEEVLEKTLLMLDSWNEE